MDILNPENLDKFLPLIFQAATDKNWFLLVALGAIGAVYIVRKLVAPKVPFFATQAGGAILTFLVAFAGAFATTLMGGGVVGVPMLLAALKIAFTAAGGWTLVKHLLSLIPTAKAEAAKAEAAKAGAEAAKKIEPKSLEDIANGK